MKDSSIGVIVLAAGMGKRMKSDKAKVLHELHERPMINYVVDAAQQVVGSNVVVVVGHQAEQVKQTVSRSYQVHYALQAQQLGTGHAVLCALPSIPEQVHDVIVLCGDVPLIRPSTIRKLVGEHQTNSRDVTVLAVEVCEPTGYGRVLIGPDNRLMGIVEQADATEAQKKIKLINTGIYAIQKKFLAFALPQLCSNNAQNEIYLTDIIGFGYQHNRPIGALIGNDPNEIVGINSLSDLQNAEKLMKIMSC